IQFAVNVDGEPESIHVTDTNPGGIFGPVSADSVHQYQATVDCSQVNYSSDGEGTKTVNNVATVAQTGESVLHAIVVRCRAADAPGEDLPRATATPTTANVQPPPMKSPTQATPTG